MTNQWKNVHFYAAVKQMIGIFVKLHIINNPLKVILSRHINKLVVNQALSLLESFTERVSVFMSHTSAQRSRCEWSKQLCASAAVRGVLRLFEL